MTEMRRNINAFELKMYSNQHAKSTENTFYNVENELFVQHDCVITNNIKHCKRITRFIWVNRQRLNVDQ